VEVRLAADAAEGAGQCSPAGVVEARLAELREDFREVRTLLQEAIRARAG